MMRRVLAGITLAVLMLGACADRDGGDPLAAPGTSTPVMVPPGAVKIGDDLYMVELAAKAGDCPAFRPWSPTKMVAQAIYYRGRSGGFVLDRAVAAC